VPMPAVLPRFSRTPGGVRFTGPRLGEHNPAIYGDLLGLSPTEQAQLHADGVI
jgi:crotonobetainyl-CoA:carnitine CoA-transferase CaiB-like acyl-CoA transferase